MGSAPHGPARDIRFPFEGAPQPIQGELRGPPPNLRTITGQDSLYSMHLAIDVNGDPDGAHRLLGRTAARTRDACDPDTDVRCESLSNIAGHRTGDRFAHRAMLDELCIVDMQLTNLDAIVVRDDTTHERRARAGNRRETHAE